MAMDGFSSTRIVICLTVMVAMALAGCGTVSTRPSPHIAHKVPTIGTGAPPESSVVTPEDKEAPVELVTFDEPAVESSEELSGELDSDELVPGESLPMGLSGESLPLPYGQPYPIDLGNALALAGANNLQVQLARQRICEAQARWLKAKVQLLPSVRFGLGYTKHEGQIQATEGDVIKVSRNALFVGGGAGLGVAPLVGGAGGPIRMMVDLSLADAVFDHLVAKQVVCARRNTATATRNDELLKVALGYYDLVEGYAQLSSYRQALDSASDMVDLTRQLSENGKLASGEVYRALAEQGHWERMVEDGRRELANRTVELAYLLRLDTDLVLVPVEEQLAPVELIDDSQPIESLVAQALTCRPELAAHQAIVRSTVWQMKQEHARPWLPSVHAGASGGLFGGGTGGSWNGDGSRGDFDLLAVWELENLGYGTRARRQERTSQVSQARTQVQLVQQEIMTEVATSTADIRSYRRQFEIARQRVEEAGHSLTATHQRIREAEGLPLELLQAIRARSNAEVALTSAIGDFNRAQHRLLYAVGNDPLGAGCR